MTVLFYYRFFFTADEPHTKFRELEFLGYNKGLLQALGSDKDVSL